MYFNDSDKKHCYGCGVCVAVCPKKCINLVEDHEGFRYPVVDEDQCVKCGLCEKACPYDPDGEDIQNSCFEAKAYVGMDKNAEVVNASSSGGAFTSIYTYLLQQNYIIYGVKFDENLQVMHDYGRTETECEAFRTSKYVLSRSEHCYQQILAQLRDGEKVAFTGTPCQCAALRQYLKIWKVDTDNLLLVDLVCHGAPNQKIFDAYIEEISRKNNSRVCRYRFRNKMPIDGRINSRSARIDFESGKTIYVWSATDSFLHGYYRRLFYRPSCAECRFAQIQRVSDITIADAWGIESIHPDWNSLKGVSLVLLNSPKGGDMLPALQERMNLHSVALEWAKENSSQLNRPTQMHARRDVFFRLWPQKGFTAAEQIATRVSLFRRAYRKLRKLLRRLVKRNKN